MTAGRSVLFAALIVGFSLVPIAAEAAPIYVDFGDSQGSANDLVDGTLVTWNVVPTINPFVPLDLDDLNGHDTGIQISAMTGFDTNYDDTLAGGQWNVPGIPWSVGEATHDDFASSTGATVVFSNLLSDLYRLKLISSRGDSAGTRNADYLVNGAYADSGGATGSNPFSASIDGWVNKSIMTWQWIAPDVSGQITLQTVPLSGNWSYVNAVELSAVPEPSSLMLLLLGGLLAGMATWRKRRA